MKTTERQTVPPADRAEIVDALYRLGAGQMGTAERDRQVRTGMEQPSQLYTRHHRRESACRRAGFTSHPRACRRGPRWGGGLAAPAAAQVSDQPPAVIV
jgi:hypothetical protein